MKKAGNTISVPGESDRMDIRVEQECPQCGAAVTLAETDQLLTCSFCGVKNYLQANGLFRYVLPAKVEKRSDEDYLYAPYLRFKGTVFLVSSKGITHRVVDTTQSGNGMPGLPPSLGVRPQAMQLQRLDHTLKGRFLPQSIKANVILEKAVNISSLSAKAGKDLYHRAYIGEHLSHIYLPLAHRQQQFFDGVTNTLLVDEQGLDNYPVKGQIFKPQWKLRFLPTLCPHCGAGLAGEHDCQVMTCTNCDSAWECGGKGFTRVEWQIVPGTQATHQYLPFWKVSGHIPALDIYSFKDFIQRTNQPFLPKPGWEHLVMSFMIPAIKLRPKNFLKVGRQATLGQWRLNPVTGKTVKNLFPVTLPAAEARQAIKIMLAASTASQRNIFPFLPKVQLREPRVQLIYLPFTDKGHDWLQPDTGVVIPKNILRFGRSM